MRLISLFLLLTITTQLKAQYYGDEQVSIDQLSVWNVEAPTEYTGTYHFGFSEGECELRVFVDDTLHIAQKTCYDWRDSIGFINTYYNFSNVQIKGNKFFSDETNGEFVILSQGISTHAGLLVYKPWTDQFYEGGEFGSILPDEDGVYLPGDYPEASLRVLDEEELRKLSSEKLKIIRNEIFARYGYVFKKGGDMYEHFSTKDWYQPLYTFVGQWFTAIERMNIETIQKIERERK